MAISTDTVVDFFGTQDLVTSTAATSIGSSAFSSTAHIVAWTNDDNAPEATFVLSNVVFNTAPSSGGVLPLYARLMGVGAGSTNMTIPSTTFKHHLIGVFPVKPSTEVQLLTQRAFLPNGENSQEYQFFLENQCSQTLSSDFTLHATPQTVGPSTA